MEAPITKDQRSMYLQLARDVDQAKRGLASAQGALNVFLLATMMEKGIDNVNVTEVTEKAIVYEEKEAA